MDALLPGSVKPTSHIAIRTLVSRKNPSINKKAISGPARLNFPLSFPRKPLKRKFISLEKISAFRGDHGRG
jgi:hypothetical protein